MTVFQVLRKIYSYFLVFVVMENIRKLGRKKTGHNACLFRKMYKYYVIISKSSFGVPIKGSLEKC